MFKSLKISSLIIISLLLTASFTFNILQSNIPDRFINLLYRKEIIKPKIVAHESKIIESNYYKFELTQIFPVNDGVKKQSISRYGGLEIVNNSIIYVDGKGGAFFIDDDKVVIGPDLNIPNHKKEFRKFLNYDDFLGGYFGIKDILVRSKTDKISEIYISSTDFNEDKGCYFLSVFKNEIDINRHLLNDKWHKIIETKPCLPKHKVSIFLGQSAGGRLASGLNGDIYLSVGDFYFDGVNDKNILRTNDSDYGKILLLPKGDSPKTVVAQGLRNPEGLFYSKGVLFETEHGPQGGDELNLIKINKTNVDYGWPDATFGVNYGATEWPLDSKNLNHFLRNFSLPMYSWIPSIGASNVLVIDKNSKLSRWNDNLLIAALKDQCLYRLVLDEKNRVYLVERINIGFRIRDLIQRGADFYLLEDSLNPSIWKLSLKD